MIALAEGAQWIIHDTLCVVRNGELTPVGNRNARRRWFAIARKSALATEA